jgi:hypothetical protein
VKKLIVTLVPLGLLAACAKEDVAHVDTWGGSQRVVLYSATGTPIATWDTDGSMKTRNGSDGWHFVDKATGKLVHVSGTVVITQNATNTPPLAAACSCGTTNAEIDPSGILTKEEIDAERHRRGVPSGAVAITQNATNTPPLAGASSCLVTKDQIDAELRRRRAQP